MILMMMTHWYHDNDETDHQIHDDDYNRKCSGVFGWESGQGGTLSLLHSTGH